MCETKNLSTNKLSKFRNYLKSMPSRTGWIATSFGVLFIFEQYRSPDNNFSLKGAYIVCSVCTIANLIALILLGALFIYEKQYKKDR
jgi:hypothetical protein